ncbi:hypothetical protein C8R46DRAFT_1063253 [Mycena filopes]|nr:hypothetical protein C8R46DRAFT_1063253 [Mycena filopes]
MSQLPPPLFPSEHWKSDSAYITARVMKSSFGMGALIGIPAYAAMLVLKRPRVFSVERLLNVSTVSSLAAAGAGGAVTYGTNRLSDAAALKERRVQLAYSVSARREDDYGTIGALLLMVILPAVFWTRAGLLDLTLGGGSLGYGTGLLTHHIQTLTGSPAGKIPETAIPADDPRMRRR